MSASGILGGPDAPAGGPAPLGRLVVPPEREQPGGPQHPAGLLQVAVGDLGRGHVREHAGADHEVDRLVAEAPEAQPVADPERDPGLIDERGGPAHHLGGDVHAHHRSKRSASGQHTRPRPLPISTATELPPGERATGRRAHGRSGGRSRSRRPPPEHRDRSSSRGSTRSSVERCRPRRRAWPRLSVRLLRPPQSLVRRPRGCPKCAASGATPPVGFGSRPPG